MVSLPLPFELFFQCLSPTDASTSVRFQAAITKAAGGMHVEAFNGLDLEEYEKLGRCKTRLMEMPAPVSVSTWGGPEHDEIHRRLELGAWVVEWRDETIHVVAAEWREGFGSISRRWVIARTREVVHEFALDIARVTNDPRDAVLVFHGGCWQRSHDLWKATQQASFDDLILASSLKERIRDDFRRFLGARESYDRVGVPWRRGALFLGPPGNGKTHCLRALVKELGVPSVYVQSLKHRYETEEANLKAVFDRVRLLRPCVLVLEDIDALINAENRSFFLNQLDGFEKNVGLIVVATTNHPDRIDPAIIDRPSRFDRKYHFDLPELAERRAYLALWQGKLASQGWSTGLTDRLAEATTGYSFAYIKELVVTTLTKAAGGDDRPLERIATEECESLTREMKTRSGMGTVSVAAGDLADDD